MTSVDGANWARVGRSAYFGSASKTLAPALRLAWMVLRSELADQARPLD
jgi:DNA-binding transcriptional MocR family regulator